MANATTLIGRDTRIKGRVTGASHDVEVQGHLEGELTIEGDVRIDATGTVAADIRARRIVVAGAVKGNLNADDAIVLEAGARVVGDLRAPRIAIAVGGLLRGHVETGAAGAHASPRKATAGHHAPAKVVHHAPAKHAHTPPAKIVHAKKDHAKAAPKMTLAGGKSAPRPVVPVLKKGTKAALTKRR
jgi:cytoskeletal protein CcmA (bactofilin family)